MPYQHVGARYYNPSSGRFLQRDPIGIRGGLNVYSYAYNSPLAWIDPSGLSAVAGGIAVGVGEVVSGVGAVAVGGIAVVAVGVGTVGYLAGELIRVTMDNTTRTRLSEEIDRKIKDLWDRIRDSQRYRDRAKTQSERDHIDRIIDSDIEAIRRYNRRRKEIWASCG